MRVFVTGSASCLATVLLPILCEDPNVDQVTGIDIRPTRYTHAKLNTEVLDIRAPNLADRVAEYDAVIHLAFAVQRKALSSDERDDINVRGSINVVNAAFQNGIQKFINLSSVSVYGAGDNIA